MSRLLILCLLMGVPLSGVGQESRGGYLGVSIGLLGHDFDGSVVSVDVISESLGVYGGYRLNDHFAVEFGYTTALDLGFVEVTESDLGFEDFTELNLMTASVIGFVPIGSSRWEFLGGGGLFVAGGSVKSEFNFGQAQSEKVDDEGLWFVLGAQRQFTKLVLRTGLELYELENSAWRLGVGIQFGL